LEKAQDCEGTRFVPLLGFGCGAALITTLQKPKYSPFSVLQNRTKLG